jgi:hypothetical protein
MEGKSSPNSSNRRKMPTRKEPMAGAAAEEMQKQVCANRCCRSNLSI